jgi:hypothetical protein
MVQCRMETVNLIASGRSGRERARPKECTNASRCYVEIGPKGLCPMIGKVNADKCAACGGRLFNYSSRGRNYKAIKRTVFDASSKEQT